MATTTKSIFLYIYQYSYDIIFQHGYNKSDNDCNTVNFMQYYPICSQVGALDQ